MSDRITESSGCTYILVDQDETIIEVVEGRGLNHLGRAIDAGDKVKDGLDGGDGLIGSELGGDEQGGIGLFQISISTG